MVSRSVPPWIMNIVACVARREWNVTSSRSILFLAVRMHRIPRSRVRDWLAEHPDWAERMRRDGRDYWRRAKRRQRSRREYATDDPLFLPTEPVPKGLVQGSLF